MYTHTRAHINMHTNIYLQYFTLSLRRKMKNKIVSFQHLILQILFNMIISNVYIFQYTEMPLPFKCWQFEQ